MGIELHRAIIEPAPVLGSLPTSYPLCLDSLTGWRQSPGALGGPSITLSPLSRPVGVTPSVKVSLSETEVRSAVKKAVRMEPLFKLLNENRHLFVKHQMRWAFSISPGDLRDGTVLADVVRQLDPFAVTGSKTIRADLHLHTAWSDGSASVGKMAQAIKDSGLEYFAVTDHSRSSKLQGGLTPVPFG